MRSASAAARRFRNVIALLNNIDRHELEETGAIMAGPGGDKAWDLFVENPVRSILMANDDQLDRIYKALERRGA